MSIIIKPDDEAIKKDDPGGRAILAPHEVNQGFRQAECVYVQGKRPCRRSRSRGRGRELHKCNLFFCNKMPGWVSLWIVCKSKKRTICTAWRRDSSGSWSMGTFISS